MVACLIRVGYPFGMGETASPAPPLNYAQPPKWRRQKRVRMALLALAAGVFAFSVWGAWEVFAWDVRFLRLQHRALNYSVPAGTTVYSSGAVPTSAGRFIGGPFTISNPPEWWIEYDFRPGRFSRSACLLFLHSRRRPDGAERLVAVQFEHQGPDSHTADGRPAWHMGLYGESFTPVWNYRHATLKKPPDPETCPHVLLPEKARFRIFAGQSDPNDAAHFTIPYSLDDQSGLIDGRLRDDDSVDLKVTGPLVFQPPVPGQGESRSATRTPTTFSAAIRFATTTRPASASGMKPSAWPPTATNYPTI